MTINSLLSEETIANKIYFIRNQKVMLDRDLAILYGIETKVLNQAVKRNMSRFPEDFMFQLTEIEFQNLKSQIVTSSWGGTRKLPYAFTEHGVLMLSSVLKKRQSHSGKYSNYAHFYQSTTNAFGHHRIKNRHPPDSEKIRKSRQKY